MITIGNKIFKTKKEAKEYVKQIMYAKLDLKKNFEKDDDDFEFLRAMCNKKNIVRFIVMQNPMNKSIYHCEHEDENGNRDAVGFLKIIDSHGKEANSEKIFKENLLSSMRKAIRDHTYEFKKKSLLRCEICNITNLEYVEYHVDHNEHKFRDISSDFLRDNKDEINMEDDDVYGGKKLCDGNFKKKWYAHHNSIAKYRILCQTCNTKLG